MPIQQTKNLVNGWLANVYPKLKARQDWWFTQYGRYFQLPRFPQFPATDGSALSVLAEDLDKEQDDEIPVPDELGPYETEPVRDPFGFVMTPGVLRAGRTWKTPPAQHPTLPYYAEPGEPAPLPPVAIPSWRRALTAMGESLPAQLDFALEVNVYRVPPSHPGWTAENDGHGWWAKAHILWDNRGTYWTRAKGEGPEAAARTWNWREEAWGEP